MSASDDSSSMLPTLLLLGSAVAGFVLSNTSMVSIYNEVLATKLSFGVGSFEVLNKSLLMLINDGLMAIFFLFVGLELKRELVVGELSDVKRAILPTAAALGGMIAPALLYLMFNTEGDAKSGWGIPMATDIAFALGVLTAFGSKLPKSLKVILAAIAIVDDLGAICVIAFFYTSQIGFSYLMAALVIFVICIVLNRVGVTQVSIYGALGVFMWYFMLKSGVHATISGVLLAFTIPLAPKSKSTAKVISDIFENKASPLDSPAVFLEKSLLKWVGFIIIPIFALANSGVALNGVEFGTISYGVILGLVLGKPVGIVGFAALVDKLGLGSIPKGVSWAHMVGLGCLAGIGFTMSLFIGSLAFVNPASYDEAKIAILTGSVISAIFGVIVLSVVSKSDKTGIVH